MIPTINAPINELIIYNFKNAFKKLQTHPPSSRKTSLKFHQNEWKIEKFKEKLGIWQSDSFPTELDILWFCCPILNITNSSWKMVTEYDIAQNLEEHQ